MFLKIIFEASKELKVLLSESEKKIFNSNFFYHYNSSIIY